MGDESLDEWFKREILPHEQALLRYLGRMWPRGHEIPDLRQDTYVRVYSAAMVSRPTSPRSFLFTTAHHMITDRAGRPRLHGGATPVQRIDFERGPGR